MNDLVARLRIRLCIADANEAADRIEALEAALRKIEPLVLQQGRVRMIIRAALDKDDWK